MSDPTLDSPPRSPLPRDQSAENQAASAQNRAAIDRSCAGVCLAAFASALFWLALGSVLAILASAKFHLPYFLSDWGPLSFGRVRPAHLNTVIYGWSSLAAVGVFFWLFCRLTRRPMPMPSLGWATVILWNIGVALGCVAILGGGSRGIEWMEFPWWAAMPIFMALGLLGFWSVITFHGRREPHVYVSLWYLLGAAFWFPWLYAASNLLLHITPIRGVSQASINWWYGHNILGVWFTPVGLAAAYYLLPKVLGRPIHSYYLSILGFWTLAFFYNWAGAHHLIGGPLPAWLITLSTVASVMMIIPVTTVALNHHMTMKGHFYRLKTSPTLRFVVLGAMAYTLVSLQGSMMSIRTINQPLHFTHHTVGHAHLGMYGFFTLMMFGAMYYIVPRLTGRDWASSGLISLHFWTVILGLAMMVTTLTLGGIIQGMELNHAQRTLRSVMAEEGLIRGTLTFLGGLEERSGVIPFIEVVGSTIPWLTLRTVAGMVIVVGHLAFIALFWMNVRGLRPRRPGAAELGPSGMNEPPLGPQAMEMHGR
ncbi:MAG: cbb3-type cytochrome c oxidase subunit I [Phycisphaeraceae bacterium]|nr:cbb3-type cytochrome c oxidase subunit I [Phycisphaeraceae bacterium]